MTSFISHIGYSRENVTPGGMLQFLEMSRSRGLLHNCQVGPVTSLGRPEVRTQRDTRAGLVDLWIVRLKCIPSITIS